MRFTVKFDRLVTDRCNSFFSSSDKSAIKADFVEGIWSGNADLFWMSAQWGTPRLMSYTDTLTGNSHCWWFVTKDLIVSWNSHGCLPSLPSRHCMGSPMSSFLTEVVCQSFSSWVMSLCQCHWVRPGPHVTVSAPPARVTRHWLPWHLP